MIHPEVREWLHEVRKADQPTAALIGQAIQHVIDGRGPDEGRPLVDRIKGSRLHRGWYEVAIPLAEARYAEHLAVLNDEGE
ncbi:MAG: hypothetical protein ACRDRP_03395 [Pseudonocardiaceae bacterium]